MKVECETMDNAATCQSRIRGIAAEGALKHE